MLFSLLSLLLLAFAGGARGSTPPGTLPSNTNPLIVTFGTSLAIDGATVSTTEARTPPVIGLTKPYPSDTFTIFMVDLDANFLHWAQTGLGTTDAPPRTVAGVTFYALENARRATALQAYLPPNPPGGPPHRYAQYLMNTTALSKLVVSQAVAAALASRRGLNVSQLFADAARPLVAANWWNTSRPGNGSIMPNMSAPIVTTVNAAPPGPRAVREIAPLLSALAGLAALISLL